MTTWTYDRDWWAESQNRGWIRRVILENGDIRFVCWHNFGPVLYYFHSFEEAKLAWEAGLDEGVAGKISA